MTSILRPPATLAAGALLLALAGCGLTKDDKKDSGSTTTDTQPARTTQSTPATTSTADTTPTTGGQTVDAASQKEIDGTIGNYFNGAREGDAKRFCGEQSDPKLARDYGSLSDCLKSDEASKPDSSIPASSDLTALPAVVTGDNEATDQVSSDGGDEFEIVLVDEGGQGGWAVDSVRRK